jgi:hypothetical protein
MIERLYPGVYLEEVAFKAQPIDGVSTATPAPTPAWTDTQTHDPGITLLELLAYAIEPLQYRADLAAPGIAQGLAVTPANAGAQLHVSPGVALDSQGRTLEVDLAAVASRYIGETEKNLGTVFGDAPQNRALLRYDDADALFDDDD